MRLGRFLFTLMTPLILLTNDDGIGSHGLWSAARTLALLGEVVVVAPPYQYSGAGRGMPTTSTGVIEPRQVFLDGKEWTAYAVAGAPAQVVLYAVLEILKRKPDLVVSGINYGENVGSGIAASGTVGAALEAADMNIPCLAISLETEKEHHYSNTDQVDFSTAVHFTHFFGQALLSRRFPADVHVLKVDVPDDATPETPWEITRMSMSPYFENFAPERADWSQPARLGYETRFDVASEPEGTDVHTLRIKRRVSVTPLSLDMTSRVDFRELDQLLRK